MNLATPSRLLLFSIAIALGRFSKPAATWPLSTLAWFVIIAAAAALLIVAIRLLERLFKL